MLRQARKSLLRQNYHKNPDGTGFAYAGEIRWNTKIGAAKDSGIAGRFVP
jgi:hypothetical protein